MKWSVIILLLGGIIGSASGQAPQGINYQGVARDSEGKPVASRDIAIRVTILVNGPAGDTEYAEIHEVMTNQFGLFTIVIGQGEATVSSFNFVGWANGNKWLQIEMDINGGRSFQLMGSQQLMSVPYALYAQYAGNSLEAGQGISINNNRITNTGDADNSPTNELNAGVSLGPDYKLRITDAGGTQEADLSPLLGASQNLSDVLSAGNSAGNQNIVNLALPVNGSDAATKAYVDAHVDGDSNPTNEIQDLTLSGNTLKITNNANATAIDLQGYLDNTDNQDLSLNVASHTLQLSGDGTPVSLAPYLDNTDNQHLSLNADVLSLTGDGTSVDLSAYRQTLSRVGNLLNISGASSPIDLTPYLDNTDTQAISLNAGTNILSISGNASTADLSAYKQNLSTGVVDPNTRSLAISSGNSINVDVRDADASVTNEIQDLNSVLTQGTDAGAKKITNLAAPTVATDAATKAYVDAHTDGDSSPTNEIQNLNSVLTQGTDAGAKKISNLAAPTLAADAATKAYVDAHTDGDSSPTNEIQNLNSVLTQGTDAGAKKISNLAAPTTGADAATKQYVDDADAVLSSKISTTYAFKGTFNYVNTSGLIVSDQTMPFVSEEFDSFNVLGVTSFTASENGTYAFFVEGYYNTSLAGGSLSLLYNSMKYPITIVQPFGAVLPRFSATFMFQLTAGQTITLVGDNVSIGGQFNGKFFGFKL